ncbi:MAG: archease [Trueperaceae bacterium]|nr:archease [Trueperaceae bacterium]
MRETPKGTSRPLDHTGDVALEVRAEHLNGLFAAAARGLLGILFARPPSAATDGTVQEDTTLTLTASSLEELLVAWLDEVLFLVQTRARVPADLDVVVREEGGAWRLEARLGVAPLDAQAQEWQGEVKATTHHGLHVEHRQGGWRAEVVFDV